jgi:anti-sigma regulatory factor (Ser/Thr protein kinase)
VGQSRLVANRDEKRARFSATHRFEVSMIWTYAAEDPQAPAHAREAVRAYAAERGADSEMLAAIGLCVSEAVSNAVQHAYRNLGHRGPVEVEARSPEGYLCVYVRDHGSGMRRRPDSPGLGLGLGLISESAWDLDIRPAREGGTEVLMRFELAARPQEKAAS